MRYYDIQVSDPTSGTLLQRWTSHPNGVYAPPDPGALNVELRLYSAAFGVPGGGDGTTDHVRIWGIPISYVGPQTTLNGMNAAIYGGMGTGYPLANPAQAGLLVTGQIFQAFGNWVGTNMTLDMYLVAAAAPPQPPSRWVVPQNYVLNWQKGTPLGPALTTTLQTARPGAKVTTQLSANLIAPETNVGLYPTLERLATFLGAKSRAIIGGSYAGVSIAWINGAFVVSDGTAAATPKPISFFELIGQPTWVAPGEVQIICPMRSDIHQNDIVTLPVSPITITPQAISSQTQQRAGSIFQGNWTAIKLLHAGDFKQPNATAWVTALNLATAA